MAVSKAPESSVMPSFSQKSPTGEKTLAGYSVKYIKADLDDPVQTLTLENIESKGLMGEDIVLLSKERFYFMDRAFIVLEYAEKND